MANLEVICKEHSWGLIHSSSRIWSVSTAAEFTAALAGTGLYAERAYGDIIELAKDTTFEGTFTIPAGIPGTGILTIQAAGIDSDPDYPDSTTRVTPANGTHLPIIQTTSQQNPALVISENCDRITLKGLHIHGKDSVTGLWDNGWLEIAVNDSALANLPEYITLDRILINEAEQHTNRLIKNLVSFNASHVTIRRCYIHGAFYWDGSNFAETHCVSASMTSGDWTVDDNFFGSATILWLFGGVGGEHNRYGTLNPSGFTFTRNHFWRNIDYCTRYSGYNSKPHVWKGMLEFKLGTNLIIRGNRFENAFLQDENAFPITITIKNHELYAGTRYFVCDSALIEYNFFLNCNCGVDFSTGSDWYVAGFDDAWKTYSSNCTIKHNVLYLHNASPIGDTSNKAQCFSIVRSADCVIEHNTVYTNSGRTFLLSYADCTNLVIRYNVIDDFSYPYSSNSPASNLTTFLDEMCGAGLWSWVKNVTPAQGLTGYPTGERIQPNANQFWADYTRQPTITSAFVTTDDGDWTPTETHVGYNAAVGAGTGYDHAGANWTALQAAMTS